MSLDRDPVIDGVLREARAAASPGAADLAQALKGIRQRILEAPVLVHDAPGGSAACDAAGLRGTRAQPSGKLTGAKWAVRLRRLLGTAVTLGLGFAIGVQYARYSPSPAPARALPSASPLGPAMAQPALVPPLAADALASARASAVGSDVGRAADVPSPSPQGAPPLAEPAATEPVVASTERRAKVRARVGALRSPKPAARAAPVDETPDAETLSFAQVLERLERAQRAERDLEPEAALRLLDELDANSDARTLREERLVTRVLAACDVGDAAAAQRAARELGHAGQASAYTGRIARSCAAPAPAASAPSPR